MSSSGKPGLEWPAVVARTDSAVYGGSFAREASAGSAGEASGGCPGAGGVTPAGVSDTRQSLQNEGGGAGAEWHLDYHTVLLGAAEVPICDEVVRARIADHVYGEARPDIFKLQGGTPDFEERWVGPFGVEYCCTPRDKSGGAYDGQLMLRGEAFEHLTFEGWRGLFRELQALCPGPMKHRRLDQAWDRPGFSLAEAVGAAGVKDVRTRAHSARLLGEHELWGGEGATRTLYIGKRGSDRLVRMYDKRGYLRVEQECLGSKASGLWCLLMNAKDAGEAEAVGRGFLRDFVDFVDRESDSNITRCSLLPWWAAFAESVPKVRGVVAKVRDKFTNWDGYLRRQAGRCLARMAGLHLRVGTSFDEWLASVLREGQARLTGADAVLMDRAALEVASLAEPGEESSIGWLAIKRRVLCAVGPP